MSRNRAFRLLKDARARASATSVGGASSRVGGHAAVNATNLTRYVYICVRFFRKRRFVFLRALQTRVKPGIRNSSGRFWVKSAREKYSLARITGRRTRINRTGARSSAISARCFDHAPFRSSLFLRWGGASEVFNRKGLFFLSSMPICFYVEMLIFGSKLTFPSISSLRTVHTRKASVTFPCKSCNSA